MFYKKGDLKKLRKILRKTLALESLFRRCSVKSVPVNFAKFLRTPFLQNRTFRTTPSVQ